MKHWLPILSFHRVCEDDTAPDPLRLCTSTRHLERILQYLRNHQYRFVSPEKALEVLRSGRPPGARYVCLTFDDGYEDFYLSALPLLREYKAPATVFLVTDCLGATNRWDQVHNLGAIPLLSLRQVLELDSQGVEFGSHSASHRRLTSLKSEELTREVRGSREALEQLLGHEVRFFCYPHGDQSPEVREEVRDAGYAGACGIEQAAHEPFLLHRIDVSQTSWPATLFRLWGWRYALQHSRTLRAVKGRMLPARPTGAMEAGR